MAVPEEPAHPGHAEIEAARTLHPNSGAWAFFMREVVGLPHELTPRVSQSIRLEHWKSAPDPLEALRLDALRAHRHGRGAAPGWSTIARLRNDAQ